MPGELTRTLAGQRDDFPGLRQLADEEGHAYVLEQGKEPGDAGLLPRSLAAARCRD